MNELGYHLVVGNVDTLVPRDFDDYTVHVVYLHSLGVLDVREYTRPMGAPPEGDDEIVEDFILVEYHSSCRGDPASLDHEAVHDVSNLLVTDEFAVRQMGESGDRFNRDTPELFSQMSGKGSSATFVSTPTVSKTSAIHSANTVSLPPETRGPSAVWTTFSDLSRVAP